MNAAAVVRNDKCDRRLASFSHSHTLTHTRWNVPSKWKNNVLFRVVFFLLLFPFSWPFSLSRFYKIFILFIPCGRMSSDFLFFECVFYRSFSASLTVLFLSTTWMLALMKCMCREKKKKTRSAFVLFTLFSSFFHKKDNTLKIELAISVYLQPKSISWSVSHAWSEQKFGSLKHILPCNKIALGN